MLTTAPLKGAHRTLPVKSTVVPSARVPAAVNCVVSPIKVNDLFPASDQLTIAGGVGAEATGTPAGAVGAGCDLSQPAQPIADKVTPQASMVQCMGRSPSNLSKGRAPYWMATRRMRPSPALQ
jgi:hypothetical protein